MLQGCSLKTLEVYCGISPVSAGIETIGGIVIANSNKGEFTDDSTFEFHGEPNGDAKSSGYGIMKLRCRNHWTEQVSISDGVENIFD